MYRKVFMMKKTFVRKMLPYALAAAALAPAGRAAYAQSSPEKPVAVTSIPKEMEDFGFRLVPYNGTHALSVPTHDRKALGSYTPDLAEVPGTGVFSRIDFKRDGNKGTVSLATTEGEHATFEVDQRKNTIDYSNTVGGITTAMRVPYERNLNTLAHIANENKNEAIAQIGYNSDTNELVVRRGEYEFHKERLKLPPCIKVDVLGNRHIVITDIEGDFIYSFFGEKGTSDSVIMNVSDYGLKRGEVYFDYVFGGLSRRDSVQEGINHAMDHGAYPQEFERGSKEIVIRDRKLLVRGPNRIGEYELASNEGSLNTDTCSLTYI